MGGAEVIRWDRFLPRRRSLRVLLVENDDSTRHVVAALLRNCSYLVSAVADGVKAWEVLKEKQYKFDLVLSEVDMPSLSGIDFLSKVIGCDLSKDIPVIMMSSHDSVNVVFKCMLQGAVDFLVKPVRKNELQNLWQHVWRKHCSNNCIGPSEGIDDNRMKSQDVSAKYVAAGHENADRTSKSSDNGGNIGDTQSSDPPTSDFMARYGQKADELSDSCKELAKDNGAETETNIDQDCTLSGHCRERDESIRPSHGKIILRFNEDIDVNIGSASSLRSFPNTHVSQITGFIKAIAGGHDYVALEEASNARKPTASSPLLSQDVSPGKPGLIGYSRLGFKERHILKPSAASAFSRYGKGTCNSEGQSEASPATLFPLPEGQTSIYPSHATIDNKEISSFSSWSLGPSIERGTGKLKNVPKISASGNDRECIENCPAGELSNPSHCESTTGQCNSLPSSKKANQNGIIYHPGQLELMPVQIPVGRMPVHSLYGGYGAVVRPLLYCEASNAGVTAVQAVKEALPSDQGNFGFPYQGNGSIYSLEHEGAEGAVGRGEPEAMHTEMEQMELREHCSANLFGGGGGIRCGDITDYHCNLLMPAHDGNGSEHGRSLREAALMKFRLKRKDRCFEKKVRYHSRKMLAEQRPRIKGQFVRQSAVESTGAITGEEN